MYFVKYFLLHCYFYGLECFATHIRMDTITFVLEQGTVATVFHQLNCSTREQHSLMNDKKRLYGRKKFEKNQNYIVFEATLNNLYHTSMRHQ